MIRYYSQIDLKDTASLRKENLEIQKVIGDIFKGIDKIKGICLSVNLMKYLMEQIRRENILVLYNILKKIKKTAHNTRYS